MTRKLIHIKGGSFVPGEPLNFYPPESLPEFFSLKVLPQVSVMDFYLEACLVSNKQFVQFLNIRRTVRSGKMLLLIHLGAPDCHIFRKGLKFYVEPGFEDYPVTYVTWYGADAYSRWIGKRLPTEMEWEFIAHSQTVESTSSFQKVNAGEADPSGFFHLRGNVWEWCADWFYVNDPWRAVPENPVGRITTRQKVLKGGAWDSHAHRRTASARGGCDPRLSSNTIGFRCAKS